MGTSIRVTSDLATNNWISIWKLKTSILVLSQPVLNDRHVLILNVHRNVIRKEQTKLNIAHQYSHLIVICVCVSGLCIYYTVGTKYVWLGAGWELGLSLLGLGYDPYKWINVWSPQRYAHKYECVSVCVPMLDMWLASVLLSVLIAHISDCL